LAQYLLKRVGLALLTLVLLSLLIFFAGQVLPGDPGRAILGPFAAQSAVKALDRSLGLDRPLLTQYWSWATGVAHGDLGISYQFQAPVSSFLGPALVLSLKLAAVAFVLVVPLSIIGGVVAAMNRGRAVDRTISVTGLSLTSIPEFVSGIVLIVIFAIGLKWLPVTATPPPGTSPLGQIHYLILPAIPLVFVLFGYIARMARAGTIEALDSDYVRTAILKGLPRSTVIRRHVLRNSLIPIISLFGLDFAQVIGGGAILTESIFNLHGVGQLAADAIGRLDIVVILVVVLLTAFFVVALAAVVDILYAFLDPRIRIAV